LAEVSSVEERQFGRIWICWCVMRFGWTHQCRGTPSAKTCGVFYGRSTSGYFAEDFRGKSVVR